MKTIDATLDRATVMAGTAMMLAWTLWLGFVGLVLLMAIFYAMMADSRILLISGIVLLSTPIVMTLAWAVLGCVRAFVKRLASEEAQTSPSWWEYRRDFRILYQAYYL
jgi:hypothetical protein